ncbi:unnamed protein product [Effrenium voratum]|uniref:RNA methyltransferase n=1 Tax=Effrenium voratum TaxID=2562239 RepID=A0AA36J721_9DINO|nr:unnamed protein product [Effrenium voratum]
MTSLLRAVVRKKRVVGLKTPTETAATPGFLHEETVVVNSLRQDQVVRGVPVARIDERGHGVVHVHVRQDQETFTFNYPRTLPGEKLNLRVGLAKKDRFNKKEAGSYRLAIDERTAASVDEVTPRCPHFRQECGGCAFQSLSYEAQLREKEKLLNLLMEQFELPFLAVDMVPSTPYGWHARTEFTIFLRDGLQLGLHPEGSPIPIALSQCHLHPEESQAAFLALRAALRHANCEPFDERTGRGYLRSLVLRSAGTGGSKEVLATFVTLPEAPEERLAHAARLAVEESESLKGVTWSKEGGEGERSPGWRAVGQQSHELLAGRPYLLYDFLDMQLHLSPEAFLRPNIFLAEEVAKSALEMSGACEGDMVWDAFSGQGLLSLPLLRLGCRVLALDRSLPALQAVLRHAQLAAPGQDARIFCGDLGVPAFLQRLAAAARGEPPKILLVDPGRNGMPKVFRRFLLELQAPRLLFLSGGRVMARDLAWLLKRGYQLHSLKAFDLQPHSAKLSVLAKLEWSE